MIRVLGAELMADMSYEYRIYEVGARGREGDREHSRVMRMPFKMAKNGDFIWGPNFAYRSKMSMRRVFCISLENEHET